MPLATRIRRAVPRTLVGNFHLRIHSTDWSHRCLQNSPKPTIQVFVGQRLGLSDPENADAGAST